jgi:phosphoribosylformimino-5-aminoimidazole carboxamide ribotide isomerase
MAVKAPIIASGGISNIHDVAALTALEEYGVIGMITGKALYDGTLALAEAIGLANPQK